MAELRTTSTYSPTGDQPQAIEKLADGIVAGEQFQTLVGATGTGKTATMAWTIEKVGRPALVIAHNKTLAAQLCNEFREFFPHNAVEYFVSYYDYYQPEAYVPQADLYIEKDSSRNDDIARLRLAATSSLFTRRDVVIVASVSCIYGLGSPEEWRERMIYVEVGAEHDRDLLLRKLIESQYVRNDTMLGRGRFRVKGDVVEVQPANQETAYRISFFGDQVEGMTHFDPLTGEVLAKLDNLSIWPATEYVTSQPTVERAVDEIRHELEQQVAHFEAEEKLLEAHRIRQRTEYDLEMLKELGFCNGIENYSRILEGRAPGRTRSRSSTTSRAISSSSSTSPTRRCRSSAGCTRATARASRRSSTSASGFPRRSTTGRCASTSSCARCRSSSSCRRRRGRSKAGTRRSSPSS